jgi:hypothetical protein
VINKVNKNFIGSEEVVESKRQSDTLLAVLISMFIKTAQWDNLGQKSKNERLFN